VVIGHPDQEAAVVDQQPAANRLDPLVGRQLCEITYLVAGPGYRVRRLLYNFLFAL
jgi:hypothetical protein